MTFSLGPRATTGVVAVLMLGLVTSAQATFRQQSEIDILLKEYHRLVEN